MIRNATIGDLPLILDLMYRLQPLTPYVDVPIDVPTVANTLGQCVNSAFGFAVVYDMKGPKAVDPHCVKGFMLAGAQPLWFSTKRQATDFITYAERPGAGYLMIKRFMAWAWSLSMVVEVTLAQSSGIDIERSAKLYERAGLVRVGSIFTAVRAPDAQEEAA